MVSVLAGGVDVPFPREHRYLYEDVAAAGSLISEHPPGTPHKGSHFSQRNRIISGLSLGVLAVECRKKSGTMLTMNHAMEQDRDIFAVPGPLDAPLSEGTNYLIQQGAKLVTCGGDILSEYWARFPRRLAASAPLTPEAAQARLDSLAQDREEKRRTEPAPKEVPSREFIPRSGQRERFTDDELSLLNALGDRTLSPDQLVELTQIPAKRVLSALTMLQIQGALEERPGRRYISLMRLEE